jgi:hypothetical protein
MVRAKQKTLAEYVEKIKSHLLKRYPALEFEVVKWNDTDATLYYRPYSEDDEYPIVKRWGNLATDALIEGGYHIYVIPAA